MRVFRIAIPTPDIDASRAFYEHILGIEVDATVPSRLYFHCGGVIVALVDWSGGWQGAFQPIPDHLYFATNELDTVYERAVASGAQITSGIEVQPWHERSFYCLDPHGNRLCFVDDSTLFLGRGGDWA